MAKKKESEFAIINGRAVRKDSIGKSTSSVGMDSFHDKARTEIAEDKAAIEQAKKNIVFSDVELQDIQKLDARRNKSAGTTKFEKKLSGSDTVTLKRLEAEKASKTFDSSGIQEQFSREELAKKLGKKERDITALDVFEAEQAAGKRSAGSFISRAEQAEIRANEEKNKALNQQREQTGAEIAKTVGSTAAEQKKNIESKSNVVIHGNNALNNKALARLREKGLI